VLHYRNCGEQIITAETEVCQQKGRGVRGLLKSTTEKGPGFTVTKTPRYCWKSEIKVPVFGTYMAIHFKMRLFPSKKWWRRGESNTSFNKYKCSSNETRLHLDRNLANLILLETYENLF